MTKNRKHHSSNEDITVLKQKETRDKTILRMAMDGFYIVDTEGRILETNDSYCSMIGYSSEELLKMSVKDVEVLETQEVIEKRIQQIIGTGSARFETKHRRKDGRVIVIEASVNYLLENQPKFFCFMRDITDRKQAEEKLLYFQMAVDSATDAIGMATPAGRHYYQNEAYTKLFGLSVREVDGVSGPPATVYADEKVGRQVFDIVMNGGSFVGEVKMLDKDRKERDIHLRAYSIKNKEGKVVGLVGVHNDVTEKLLLEEERLKTQKLESIGTLAGGIAHDFNNLLQGVFGYISLAKMTSKNPEKSAAALEQAEKSLHQSVNLTTQLLTFSKGGEPTKKLIDLRPVIENTAKFALSGSRSDLRMNIPEGLWQAEADGGQLGQVIQNIVLNADQSMPVGGTIAVATANMAEGDALLPAGLTKGDYVMIAIQDTGAGIPEKYLSKIFDPYFTTKEKGSGLGLATSYSIIKNHGGMIDVRTKYGEGSTFMIYIPAIVGQVRTEIAEKQQELPQSRKAKVLVMDDEEVIRNISSELLAELGHNVEVAKNGQEALKKYQGAIATGKPFDLVILDLTIRGGMGGIETVQQLFKMDPHVKAIVSSGYSDDVATANYMSQGFKASLKKPYHVEALREVLNKMLNS